ncbi:hypothetical protein VPH35_126912 [Triticum aestivum]
MISCSPAAALEDDDMLEEILLRLPPWTSSLPRASAVCKRWRGLLTDPGFLRRFGAHHREPPLVGVHAEVLVCDPITGCMRHVPIPPEFKIGYIIGTVLCAAHHKGHVNGSCHSTPFKVVLLLLSAKDHRPLASVYSSETDTWGELISTKVPCRNCSSGYLSTLVGNVLYWALMRAEDGILEFDLDRQSLDVLKGPPGINRCNSHQIIQAEDGAVGLVTLSHHYHSIQMWERKDMGTDGIFLYVKRSVYLVQLKSMQARKLFETCNDTYYHSFKSFYAPGDCST